MIEISHLTKKYAGTTAVNDINLTIEPGHVYGFLGPNGAGKTTTMNIITGYIGATSGEVKINGHDINKEPEEAKKCIGYLPELPPLYGDMTVLEYLGFVASLKKIEKAGREDEIARVMELTKLHEMSNRLIRNLSKGYRQRVGLAQALMGMPEIIILDEPTVGLDPKQIIEIRSLIRSLRGKHTVILSSHILQEISAVCDHVFIISNGKIVANDTMENLENETGEGQMVEIVIRATAEEAEEFGGIASVKTCRPIKREPAEKLTEAAEDAAETGESAEKLTEAAEDAVETGESAEKLTEAAEDAVETEDSEEKPTEAAENEPAQEEPQIETDTEEPDVCKERCLVLNAKPGRDIREDVFRHCVNHNIVLLEMTAKTRTLEDVFLELTDAAGKEADDESDI